MINSPSPSPLSPEWGGSGESALTLYIRATGPSYAFSIPLSLIANTRNLVTQKIYSHKIVTALARRILEKMMLIGLVLFAMWARIAVSELRKFSSSLFIEKHNDYFTYIKWE